MAAPMGKWFGMSRNVLFLFRNYSRRRFKGKVTILTPSGEIENLRAKRRLVDPRNNPYLIYHPDDPVQKSIANAIDNPTEPLRSHIKTSKIKDVENAVSISNQSRTNTTINNVPRGVVSVVKTPIVKETQHIKSKSGSKRKETRNNLKSVPLKSTSKNVLSYKWLERNDITLR